ncbi:MAG: 50S ribosomal protein L13 [Planctomycetota bacterium]|nr:50S ribosomal protein L13 [Planctomycetota bacterium]
MKTPMAKRGEIEPRWYLVDAGKEVLGRAATRIAMILQGKHRPTYTAHVDTGDYIVVINAEKIQATGAKEAQKMYQWYTGWHGGRKERTLADMRVRKPEEVLRSAVRRMLPKTRLGKQMLSKLKLYAGAEHPHEAQQPEPLAFNTGRSA